MQLDTMRVLVTGAASGLGRHFTLELARSGAHVAAADIDADGLTALAAEAADLPGDVATFICDVSSEEDVRATVRGGCEAIGPLNGLINNAGLFRDGLLVKRDKETGEVRGMALRDWQRVIDVDLTGPFLCTREFAIAALESDTRPGVIVNISSIARHGNVGQSNYSAAKAGLIADTRLWGTELARHGIRVGAVAPGFIDTPILRGMREDVLSKLLGGVPLRRAGDPHEIWLAVRFIIECDYFTGRCIDVDGGLTL